MTLLATFSVFNDHKPEREDPKIAGLKPRAIRVAAEAEMARRFAAMHMPEDIRSRAKAWGMEAFCEVLWANAFQAGFREGTRDMIERREGESE